ncbi:MAG: hydantoinase/oxoprolinase family protein, partial [Actinobacteria bacterium]|nr:hydantoinase/oxoprolinase family protein [Actinomycetota bacterium]
MAAGPVSAAWTVSVDTGGTFTDAVGRCSDGRVAVAKVPSTPDDPSRGLATAVSALVAAGVPREAIGLVAHGTTIATNAVLTGSLARVSLVTTEGFRDVLAYRNGSRPDVYSLTPERPQELVPRERRFEVRERVASTGEVVVPLTDDEVRRVVDEVVDSAPEAVAVCLLFGFLADEHERRLGEALREALPGIPVTLASEVAREFREYPRMSTATINAGLRPLVSGYLLRAAAAVAQEGAGGRLLVMQSNGGCAPAER